VGILVHPAVPATASIDGVRLERNNHGIRVEDGAKAAVRNSVAAGNVKNGFSAFVGVGSAELNIESSVATGNDNGGVVASGALATVRISNTMITNNLAGLKTAAGGQIVSFGNNRIVGNGSTVPPTSTLPQE
jgi:hypothetical protein